MILEFLEQNTPENYEQHVDLVNRIITECNEGNHSFVKIAVILRAAKEVIEAVESQIKDNVVEEIENSNGESEYKKFKLEIHNTSKYDYSNCNWAKYVNAKKEIETKKEIVSECEKTLKYLKQEFADPDTGELIYPASKISSKTYKVTMLKK